jgi:hypothetical protein
MRPKQEYAGAEVEPAERASDGRSGALRLAIIVLVLAFVGVLGFAFSQSGGGPSMAIAESGGGSPADIPIMRLDGGQAAPASEPSDAKIADPPAPAVPLASPTTSSSPKSPVTPVDSRPRSIVITVRSWEVRTLPQSTQVDGLLNQIHHGRQTSGSPFRTIVNSTTNAAIVRSIEALKDSGVVTDGPAPRVVTRAGDKAEVTVTEAAPSVEGYVTTRQTITIALSPNTVDDDLVRLDTKVTAATANSRTTVALQDIGFPVGTTEVTATGAVIGPHDALLVWVPQRDHGVLVELTAATMD